MQNGTYQQQNFPRNQVTAKGVVRCRFDMMARWPESAGRKMNPFCYRGDNFNITEPDKMLRSLIRLFDKEYRNWIVAEMYDNSRPMDDPDRLILRYKQGKELEHKLFNYPTALQDFPLPEWLLKTIQNGQEHINNA